jgi:hypothetical protein
LINSTKQSREQDKTNEYCTFKRGKKFKLSTYANIDDVSQVICGRYPDPAFLSDTCG